MQITKELLLAKRKQAEAQRDEYLAKANASVGAMNQLDQLLGVLDIPDPTPAATNPDPAKPLVPPAPAAQIPDANSTRKS